MVVEKCAVAAAAAIWFAVDFLVGLFVILHEQVEHGYLMQAVVVYVTVVVVHVEVMQLLLLMLNLWWLLLLLLLLLLMLMLLS